MSELSARSWQRGGRLDLFFGLILPHGLLELTAVFVAAALGLRLGWTLIAPGPRTTGRRRSHQEGRSDAVSAVVGLTVVLLVSGVIEAFVTPSGLPTWARIGIGVAGVCPPSSPTWACWAVVPSEAGSSLTSDDVESARPVAA